MGGRLSRRPRPFAGRGARTPRGRRQGPRPRRRRADVEGLPAIRLRPASRIAVAGLTWETVSIQPWSSSRGTYTGAVIRMRKTGSCIAGAACKVRIRVIIPAANRNAATLTISARPTSPKRSIPPPESRPGGQGDREDHRPDEHRPDDGGDTRSRDHRRAVARGEEEAPGEPGVEFGPDARSRRRHRRAVGRREVEPGWNPESKSARDREAGEDAAEGRRLQQHEDELEGVVVVVVEAGQSPTRREPARESDEEEDRDQSGGQEQRRTADQRVQVAPGHRARDGEVAARRPAVASHGSRAHHPLAQGAVAAPRPTAKIAIAKPKASASASASQPAMNRLRMPSIM